MSGFDKWVERCIRKLPSGPTVMEGKVRILLEDTVQVDKYAYLRRFDCELAKEVARLEQEQNERLKLKFKDYIKQNFGSEL